MLVRQSEINLQLKKIFVPLLCLAELTVRGCASKCWIRRINRVSIGV